MGKRLTKEEFIRRAIEIHGNKYDYSKVEYVNCYTPVIIICPIHGEFKMIPRLHIFEGSGCPRCKIKKVREKGSNKKWSTQDFIKKAKEAHGDRYDYSKSVYVNRDTPITIICPIHGEFQENPRSHVKGENHGNCPYCILEERKNNFIAKAKEIHGDKYDYSKVEYVNNDTPVTIICPIHGEFQQMPSNHVQGYGCHLCKNSVLENQTRSFLLEKNINFIQEMKWPWLVFEAEQPVDFYLPEYNIVIECQGIQHFEAFDYFGGERRYSLTVKRDKNKQKLCEDHGIKVVYYSNLSTETKKYKYPYKVYEDLQELYQKEIEILN